ncbi:MAG: c-type cytochrome domain-containing protein [Planctomycetota bacterium]
MRLPALLLLSPFAAAQGAADFQQKVLPIFEQRCIECHATESIGPDGKAKKPKGGVVLDSKDGITSSKKGKLVVPKKADDSLLYQAITLPSDHDDRMPPAKKGEPLSQQQTDLIKKWIDDGASFGSWTGKKPEGAAVAKTPDPAKGDDKARAGKDGGKGKPEPAKVDPLLQLAAGVKALPPATLAAFANGPFRVDSVGDGSPLLSVGCRGNADAITDAALQALTPIATHVAELDLARTRVGDEGCKLIATMARLVTLDLRQTAVGNHGVAALGACRELRLLNLFGTKAGDYGAAALAACKHLEQLFVWQTEVSAEAAVRLRDGIPGLRVVMGPDLPEPLPEGTGAGRRRR